MDLRRPGPNEILNVLTDNYNGNVALYVINFVNGGWVIVSADNSTVPVLCYNIIGKYEIDDIKPGAFNAIINSYKKAIDLYRNNPLREQWVVEKWNKLLNPASLKSTSSYNPGDQLLNVPGRGYVRWAQQSNWDGTCSPIYNKFCDSGIGEDCHCDIKPVGCGPVAMGQVMWYWEWPVTSSFRSYNWSIMPERIRSGANQTNADEVAHLLKDCGKANSWYLCGGCLATVNNIVDVLNDDFSYESAHKIIMDDWSYGTAFADLLRSELDNGRPILMRGDEGVTDLDKHHFVIDGYDASDNDWFWFNFGWGYWNTETYNTSRHYLGDISPGPHGPYDALQMVIVGISPTVAADANIYDVAYSSVWDIRLEDAQQSIELPASGKSLTVENGGDLTLIAGSSIVINPGFNAKLGSTFKAQINPDYLTDINISVQGYTSSFSPGSNEELCYNVSNTNSWEFEAYNMGGGAVFQSAGKIDSSPCCVWDGSGSSVTGYYTCTIRFKNNYGRILEHSYQVWVQY